MDMQEQKDLEAERLEELVQELSEGLMPAYDQVFETVMNLAQALSRLVQSLIDAGYTAEEIMDMLRTEEDDDSGRILETGKDAETGDRRAENGV